MVSEDFILRKVRSLLSESVKVHGPLRPPIDPVKIAPFCAVLSVEPRPMIPEGVLTPVPGGFRIYLQSNFAHERTKRRTRFTLAHELAHTFFYDLNGEMPKPLKGGPKGKRLESLCHIGASQILLPDALLRQQLEMKGEVASAHSILDLARLFDVSVEVVMRRLHELRLIADENFAAVLVDTVQAGRQVIQAACYGSLLLSNANRPARGMDFDTWVAPLLGSSRETEPSEWTRTTRTTTITAKKVFRSKRSFILDLKFTPLAFHRA
jgi:hypothetical protein